MGDNSSEYNDHGRLVFQEYSCLHGAYNLTGETVFPVHETITYNTEESDVLFVMEDFRRERRNN